MPSCARHWRARSLRTRVPSRSGAYPAQGRTHTLAPAFLKCSHAATSACMFCGEGGQALSAFNAALCRRLYLPATRGSRCPAASPPESPTRSTSPTPPGCGFDNSISPRVGAYVSSPVAARTGGRSCTCVQPFNLSESGRPTTPRTTTPTARQGTQHAAPGSLAATQRLASPRQSSPMSNTMMRSQRRAQSGGREQQREKPYQLASVMRHQLYHQARLNQQRQELTAEANRREFRARPFSAKVCPQLPTVFRPDTERNVLNVLKVDQQSALCRCGGEHQSRRGHQAHSS